MEQRSHKGSGFETQYLVLEQCLSSQTRCERTIQMPLSDEHNDRLPENPNRQTFQSTVGAELLISRILISY